MIFSRTCPLKRKRSVLAAPAALSFPRRNASRGELRLAANRVSRRTAPCGKLRLAAIITRRRGCVDMFRPIVFFVSLAFLQAVTACAADIEEVEKLVRTGRYDEAARLAGEEIEKGTWNERYSEL